MSTSHEPIVAASHSPSAQPLPLILHTRVVTREGGGPEKTILNSPRYLPPLGYRSICAYMRPAGDPGFTAIRQRAASSQAPLLEIDDGGALDQRVFRELLAICRRERVAVWHAHDYKSNFIGLWLRRFWPMKLVTTMHGWGLVTKRLPYYYLLDKFTIRFYDAIICVSDDLQQECLRWRIRPSRVRVIQNAIDTDQYQRDMTQEEARRQLGAPTTGKLIGAVGRLSSEKGFDLLIRAVHRLITAGHDVRLWIAGEGEERNHLEQIIAELGCQDRVRLCGHMNDVKPFYQALDLYVLSSRREGLPNVVLEAMAIGIPVVATRIAGVPRLVHDGVNGILVPPESTDALHDAMASLLTDQDLCFRYVAAGHRTIEESYCFRRRMQKVAAVYDELLKPATT